MPGLKTNEMPGTRAVLRHFRMSAYKAREVLDLVRGEDVDRAGEILDTTRRDGARVVAKVLASAVANARNNDQLDPEELYVSACYADEGTILKRWRPRARGRATRIRKRSCHITVIVSRLPEDRLERKRASLAAAATAMRSRRVAASRRDAARRATAAEEGARVDEELDAADELQAAADDLGTESEHDESAAESEGESESAGESEVDSEGEPAAEAETESQSDSALREENVVEPDEAADETEDAADEDASAEGVSAGAAEAADATGEEASPPPRARRARTARKNTSKTKTDTQDPGDEAGSDEDEKG